jgi:flagellar protein FlaG
MNIDTLQLATEQVLHGSRSSQSQAAAKATAAVAREPAPAPTVENVRAAAKQIESYLKSNGRALEFRVDSDTRQLVVTVRDPETGETIRQIPTEEVLQLARTLSKSADASAPTLVDVSA